MTWRTSIIALAILARAAIAQTQPPPTGAAAGAAAAGSGAAAGSAAATGSAAGSAAATGSGAPDTAAAPPLAELRDERQLAEALAQISQDPSVYADNPKARPLAQALMSEGVHQLRQHAYDQALANFLEAYAKLPSPRILLNIGSTLRDMGRLADAANTYQRYLGDPASGTDRITEVKGLLVDLDRQLTILTVRVIPKGSDISIDGGPFVTVGSTLLTRVRPGIHLVRIRNGASADELTVNGFDAENKEVYAAVKMVVAGGGEEVAAGSGSAAARTGTGPGPGSAAQVAAGSGSGAESGSGASVASGVVEVPVQAWLDTGTLYATSDPTSRERHVKTSSTTQAVVVAAIVPADYEQSPDTDIYARAEPERTISSGVLAMVRIDGEGHGFAAGLGLALAATDNIEVEIAGLRSSEWGVYGGARYRFLTGQIRPYLGAGMPVFFYSTTSDTTGPAAGMTSSSVAVGVRGAGGIELELNGHLSFEGDLGYEHFFNVSGTQYIANVFVPTIAVIGRM